MSGPDADATVVRAPGGGGAAAGADPEATVLRPRRPSHRTSDPDATVIVGAAGSTAPLPPPPRTLPLALPPGFELHEYRIERVLGQGGFGITYLATDTHLHAQVAIKEYLPAEIAFRARDRSVSPAASQHRVRYEQGRTSFLAEARTLASLRHPAIVRVARFFEAHRTAYMVLEYEKGQSLKRWWPAHREIGEQGLVELVLPLLDGLAVVHEAGFLHRDIKPDNIQVRESDGSLVLLDFGSAGQPVTDSDAVVVTPGYAPIEQYGGGAAQGPWTDLYAMAATLYWCVGGRKPPDAELRQIDPACFRPAARWAGRGFGAAFLAALDAALALEPAARPQSVAAFRRALAADHVGSLTLQHALARHDDSAFVATAPGGAEADAAAEAQAAPQQATAAATGATAGTTARARARWRRLLQRWRPRDWPLAPKLAAALVATALLPMLLAGGWTLAGSVEALTAARLSSMEQIAHGSAGRLGQFIEDGRQLTRGLAGDEAIGALLASPDAAARDAIAARLKRLQQADSDVQLLMVLDRGANVLVTTDPEVAGRNLAFRRYYREAIAGRSYTSGVLLGSVAGASGVFIAEPVRDAQGQVQGVFVLRLLGAALARILDEVRRDGALTPMLIDGDGVVVHHPDPKRMFTSLVPLSPDKQNEMRVEQRFRREFVESLGEIELARAVQGAGRPGHVAHRSVASGVDELTGFAPVPGHDWVVAVSEPRASFEAPMRRLRDQLLLTVGLVGLLAAGLALLLARSVVRPVKALTAAAGALKAGRYDVEVPVRGRDELGQLARTFNVMIGVLRQRERERGFERERGRERDR